MDERERYSSGMRVRRAVLGEDYVEKAQAATTPFNEPFKDLITRYLGEKFGRVRAFRGTRVVC